jgi:NADH-quinone oxidoreductase subunit I
MPKRTNTAFQRYFAEIWSGVATTCIGMALTLRYFFARKVTMQYPEERPEIPPTHRGLHAYEEEKCTACNLCLNTCPVSCIAIEAVGKGRDALVLRYEVDYSKCLFCNLCAEACPSDCLRLTEEYNMARGRRSDCVRSLARPKTEAEIAAQREAMAQREAERKAKTQEAQKS